MNEGIDIAFLGAKVAAQENKAANIAVHGVSVAYNISQMFHYRMAYFDGQRLLTNGALRVTFADMAQCRREMIKHSLLASLDIFSLFLISFHDRR